MKRLAVRTVLALAVAPLLLALATPASAYTHSTTGSWPGTVSSYQVQGSHYNSCPNQLYSCWSPWLHANGPVIGRSPATAAPQVVTALYQLQRWTGSYWAVQGQRSYAYSLNGSSFQLPPVDFLPGVAGSFRVQIVVLWADATATRTYGSRTRLFNGTGDYVCFTRFGGCAVGAGWVTVNYPR